MHDWLVHLLLAQLLAISAAQALHLAEALPFWPSSASILTVYQGADTQFLINEMLTHPNFTAKLTKIQSLSGHRGFILKKTCWGLGKSFTGNKWIV